MRRCWRSWGRKQPIGEQPELQRERFKGALKGAVQGRIQGSRERLRELQDSIA
jgi:hypothetical protein